MDLAMLASAAGLSAGLGALAVGGAAPQAWPLAGPPGGMLLQRVAGLLVRPPSPGRRAAGRAALVLVLIGGGLAAYAAVPSAPERPPAEVQDAADLDRG